MVLKREGRKTEPVYPEVDPFWQAFYNALSGEKPGN
jgi:hypothetical protein